MSSLELSSALRNHTINNSLVEARPKRFRRNVQINRLGGKRKGYDANNFQRNATCLHWR